MNQKFDGSIGQVAGRDVKTNGAQANVNIHVHSGADAKRFISERQRKAIGAKIYELEAKTGVEKLMVYRRLMTRFNFPNMDEMPRDLYGRVTAYLDGWIRNGEADHGSAASGQRSAGDTAPIKTVQPSPLVQRPVSPPTIEPPEKKAPSQVPLQTIRSSWAAVALGVVAASVVVSAGYLMMHRSVSAAPDAPNDVALRCEYGGKQYTVGSIVRQEGVRQRCTATAAHSTQWEPATPNLQR